MATWLLEKDNVWYRNRRAEWRRTNDATKSSPNNVPIQSDFRNDLLASKTYKCTTSIDDEQSLWPACWQFSRNSILTLDSQKVLIPLSSIWIMAIFDSNKMSYHIKMKRSICNIQNVVLFGRKHALIQEYVWMDSVWGRDKKLVNCLLRRKLSRLSVPRINSETFDTGHAFQRNKKIAKHINYLDACELILLHFP